MSILQIRTPRLQAFIDECEEAGLTFEDDACALEQMLEFQQLREDNKTKLSIITGVHHGLSIKQN